MRPNKYTVVANICVLRQFYSNKMNHDPQSPPLPTHFSFPQNLCLWIETQFKCLLMQKLIRNLTYKFVISDKAFSGTNIYVLYFLI